VVFILDKDKFPLHIELVVVVLISRSPPSHRKSLIAPQVAQSRMGQVPSRLIECKVSANISPKKEE
jgi:hypothetical protein